MYVFKEKSAKYQYFLVETVTYLEVCLELTLISKRLTHTFLITQLHSSGNILYSNFAKYIYIKDGAISVITPFTPVFLKWVLLLLNLVMFIVANRGFSLKSGTEWKQCRSL